MGEAGYSMSSDTTGEWYSGRGVPRLVVFVWVAAALLGGGAGLAQSSLAPEISTGGPFSVAEGQTPVATLAATDDDTPTAELTWSIPSGVGGRSRRERVHPHCGGSARVHGGQGLRDARRQ